MEKIKFRAWYAGGLDKMVYFGEPIVSNSTLEQGETWGMFFPIVQGKAYIAGSIPMQFTGLLDKNGKEIYEGDVIKWLNSIFPIKWVESECGFNIPSQHRSTIEVIGNIYENPELLK